MRAKPEVAKPLRRRNGKGMRSRYTAPEAPNPGLRAARRPDHAGDHRGDSAREPRAPVDGPRTHHDHRRSGGGHGKPAESAWRAQSWRSPPRPTTRLSSPPRPTGVSGRPPTSTRRRPWMSTRSTTPSLAPAPDASGMLANGKAATANGTVTYEVTFVDSTGVESNASQPVAFSPGDGRFAHPVEHPDGAHVRRPRELYNTVARNVYRLVTPAGRNAVLRPCRHDHDNYPTTTLTDTLANTPAHDHGAVRDGPFPELGPDDGQLRLAFDQRAHGRPRCIVPASGRLRGLCGDGDGEHFEPGVRWTGVLISTDAGANWYPDHQLPTDDAVAA